MLTQEHIYNYFGIVLHFANKAKVKSLFTKLGYHIEEPTAELCVQATDEYGVEFTQPFGKIAESALESPKYLAHMKVLKAGNAAISTPLNKAKGESKGESLTNEQRVELAGTIIGGISSWIASGQQIADTVINKDANAANAQAALINAQANANKMNTETQNKWLIPVIIAVVVVLVVGIVAAAVIANKKH